MIQRKCILMRLWKSLNPYSSVYIRYLFSSGPPTILLFESVTFTHIRTSSALCSWNVGHWDKISNYIAARNYLTKNSCAFYLFHCLGIPASFMPTPRCFFTKLIVAKKKNVEFATPPFGQVNDSWESLHLLLPWLLLSSVCRAFKPSDIPARSWQHQARYKSWMDIPNVSVHRWSSSCHSRVMLRRTYPDPQDSHLIRDRVPFVVFSNLESKHCHVVVAIHLLWSARGFVRWILNKLRQELTSRWRGQYDFILSSGARWETELN